MLSLATGDIQMWSGGYIGLILMCELFIPIVLDLALAPLFWERHSTVSYGTF